jgi:DNA-binding transcriptional LysR family regulator
MKAFPQLEFRDTRAVQDVFIAGSSYGHLRNKELHLKDLEKLPLLVLEKNTITREYFDNMLAGYEVEINPDIELGSIDVLVDMARIGLGIAFVPDFCAKSAAASDIFVLDIKEEVPERHMGVVTHKNIPLSVAASKFLEMLV